MAGAKAEIILTSATADVEVAPTPTRLADAPLTGIHDQVADEPAHRKAARYAWALLLARIYEVLPLICPRCGGAMRIIAFITEGPVIRKILDHLGEPTSAPTLAPARGPPLWEMLADRNDREAQAIDPQAQPAPDYEFDQRVAW